MSHKSKIDPTTGSVRQPFWLILFAAPFLFGVLAYLVGSFPMKVITFQYVGAALAIFGGLSLYWMNFRPSLLAKSFVFVCIGLMLLLITIRSFHYMFPSFQVFWSILIIISFAFAYLSPALNKRLAHNIRSSFLAPKSRLGKKLSSIATFIAPIIGTMAAMFGLITARNNMIMFQAVFVGVLAWLWGVSLPFSTRALYSKEENEL